MYKPTKICHNNWYCSVYKKNIDKCPVFASIFLATDMNTIYIFDDKNEIILDKDQFLLRSKHFLLLRQINMPLYRPILLKWSDEGIEWIHTQTHSYPNRLIVPKTLWSSKHLIILAVIIQFTSLVTKLLPTINIHVYCHYFAPNP